MVAEISGEPIAVPLKIDGVVVGFVQLGDKHEIIENYTNSSTESYLKELLLSNLVESISLSIDIVSELDNGVPEPGEPGNLRLV